MVDLGEAAGRATSANELVTMMAEKALSRPAKSRGADLSEASCRALDQWVNNSDGKAGERVSRVIMDLVEERHQKLAAKQTARTGDVQTVSG
jgi:hypothetical protein